ncbi:hypothetical protein LCGC14_1679150 [marine sediment metagenome]|uniref:Uncharacterized protein n=1 Tax=marine sediment metagenome TaxID=412755 RepID=A0A0F9HPN8_9ZZZZ
MTTIPGEVDGSSRLKIYGEEVMLFRCELVVDESNVDDEMNRVAAQISFWGEMYAAAEQELAEADAHYRAWRAVFGEKLLDANPKLAEWKIKQAIEADPKFLGIKTGLALAQRNAIALRRHAGAWEKKANVLQGKGAMRRAEFEATGMHAKVEKREKKKAAATEEQNKNMKKIFKDKKGS